MTQTKTKVYMFFLGIKGSIVHLSQTNLPPWTEAHYYLTFVWVRALLSNIYGLTKFIRTLSHCFMARY